jgi:Tfp pilus assembly protein PilE
MEVMIVVAIIAVLVSLSAPTFTRSMEQSHADIAGARLRAIWAAQRLYWLENRTYSTDLATLGSLGLLDPSFLSGGGRYTYSIVAADNDSFTAAAIRTGSARWSGQYTIDEQGDLSGTISAFGETDITPGFQ